MLNNAIAAPAVSNSAAWGLVCLEKRARVGYIPKIVKRKCGDRAAALVRSYFVQYRQKLAVATRNMGLSDVCKKNLEGKELPKQKLAEPVLVHVQTKLEKKELFEQFLERYASGSALDTVFGKYILDLIKQLPDVAAMCNYINISMPAYGCKLVAEDKDEISRFNILYAAHEVVSAKDGLRCQRLNIFHSCWNLLQTMCGANTRYVNLTFTVIDGPCGIKREMEDVPCQWQDILYSYYINGSEKGNLWPLAWNLLAKPMMLESTLYSMGDLFKSTSSLFSTLDRSIDEIGKKCNPSSANSIRIFFGNMKYGMYDFYKLAYMEEYPNISSVIGSAWKTMK